LGANEFFRNAYDQDPHTKIFLSNNLQNPVCGTFDFKELIGMLHNILFLYENQFRKKFDFKDNITSLLLFGSENKYKNLKKFSFLEITENQPDFFSNLRTNSFYFAKHKKIIYYIINIMIDPGHKDLMKNNLSLIFSLKKEEVMNLLLVLLEKYKILFQDDSFVKEKTIQHFLNDTHIFDLSQNVFDHFSKICFKSTQKSLENINEEEFERILIERLQRQTKKLFGTKSHDLYEKGGFIIAAAVVRYCALIKNNEEFIKDVFYLIKHFIKKNDLLKMCLDQNIYLIVKEEFYE